MLIKTIQFTSLIFLSLINKSLQAYSDCSYYTFQIIIIFIKRKCNNQLIQNLIIKIVLYVNEFILIQQYQDSSGQKQLCEGAVCTLTSISKCVTGPCYITDNVKKVGICQAFMMPWAVITLFVFYNQKQSHKIINQYKNYQNMFSLLMSSVIVRELWICVRRKKYQKVLVKIQDMSDEEIDKLYKQMKLNPLNSLCDIYYYLINYSPIRLNLYFKIEQIIAKQGFLFTIQGYMYIYDMVNNLSKLPNAVDTQVPSEAEATQTQSLIQSEQQDNNLNQANLTIDSLQNMNSNQFNQIEQQQLINKPSIDFESYNQVINKNSSQGMERVKFQDKEEFQQKYESHNIKMESYESDQEEEIKEQ